MADEKKRYRVVFWLRTKKEGWVNASTPEEAEEAAENDELLSERMIYDEMERIVSVDEVTP